ncbi:MAG TPA: GspH/FimT family protein [Gemmatimonadales bacterium]|nr:GspH/FimT family protein [Gemmatimonadales bacterium]
MKASGPGYSSNAQTGFTMVEVIVVLVLLTLAAAVVAPSLLPSRSESSELTSLVRNARETAIRRGETVHLRIDQSGSWQVAAGALTGDEILISGRLTNVPAHGTKLVFSPLGTCGPPAESETVLAFDPLTCELTPP